MEFEEFYEMMTATDDAELGVTYRMKGGLFEYMRRMQAQRWALERMWLHHYRGYYDGTQ